MTVRYMVVNRWRIHQKKVNPLARLHCQHMKASCLTTYPSHMKWTLVFSANEAHPAEMNVLLRLCVRRFSRQINVGYEASHYRAEEMLDNTTAVYWNDSIDGIFFRAHERTYSIQLLVFTDRPREYCYNIQLLVFTDRPREN